MASGTWTSVATSGNWSTTGNWSGGVVADGAGFTANFTSNITATTTVTVDTATRTIGNLTFSDAGASGSIWVLAGANTLALNNSGSASVLNCITEAQFSSALTITGSNGYTKSGNAAAVFFGNMSGVFGNVTQNDNGWIIYREPAVDATYTNNFTNNGSGLLIFYAKTGTTVTVTGDIVTNSTGFLARNSDLAGVGGILKFDGSITGLNRLNIYNGGIVYTKTLPSSLVLEGYGDSFYPRQFFVNAATTQSRAMTISLEDVASTQTIGAGLSAFPAAAAVTISGTIAKGGTASVTFALDGTSTFDNTHSGNTTFTTANNVAFAKNGGGKWIVSGSKTGFTSTAINGGTLQVASATGINGNVTMSAGTVLELSGGITLSNIINQTGTLRNVSGNNTLTGNITLTAATEIQSNSAGQSLTLSTGTFLGAQALTLSGVGDHAISRTLGSITSLTKNGSGTATLSGANTFTGAITANGGVISVASMDAGGGLGSGSTVNFTASGIIRYTGSTAVTFSRTLSFSSTTGAGFQNNASTAAMAITGVVSSATGTNVVALQGSSTSQYNVFSSSLGNVTAGFSRSGSGRWVVTAGNDLGGSTTVSSGTLMVSNDNYALKQAGANVTVTSGGKLQIGSDGTQKGRNAYTTLTAGGVVGTPARIRIGGSGANPTIYMNGDLTLPASGTTTFDLSANTFKTPGTYTLIEFAAGKGVVGGSITGKITASGLAAGRSAAFAYNVGTPNTITVTIS